LLGAGHRVWSSVFLPLLELVRAVKMPISKPSVIPREIPSESEGWEAQRSLLQSGLRKGKWSLRMWSLSENKPVNHFVNQATVER
jgi:hypothetical protein